MGNEIASFSIDFMTRINKKDKQQASIYAGITVSGKMLIDKPVKVFTITGHRVYL